MRLASSEATEEPLESWTQGVSAWPTICPWIAVPSTVPSTSTVIPEQCKEGPLEETHGLWTPREEGQKDRSSVLASGDGSSSKQGDYGMVGQMAPWTKLMALLYRRPRVPGG